MRDGNYFGKTACIDGKFNVATHTGVVAYDPKEGRWDNAPPFSDRLRSDSYCEIDNVLYSAAHGALSWYDSQVRQWRDLKGLVGIPSKFRPRTNVRLADYGGKIVVMWDAHGPYLTAIWCAEIALERLNSCEIWGKVEWVDRLLTISDPYIFEKVIASTL